MHAEDSPQDRQLKRESLGCLFVMCPRAEVSSKLIDRYLLHARRIPAEAYVKACLEVEAKWDNKFEFPRPADISRAAAPFMAEMRTEEQRREQAQIAAEAMTPDQARELLAEIPHGPEQSVAGQMAKDISRGVLRMIAAKGTKAIQEGRE